MESQRKLYKYIFYISFHWPKKKKMSRLNFPLNVKIRTVLRNGIFLPQLILACLLFWLLFFYFFRLTFFSLFANQERKCPFEPNMRGWLCQCTVRVCILFGASIHFNYNFPSFPIQLCLVLGPVSSVCVVLIEKWIGLLTGRR